MVWIMMNLFGISWEAPSNTAYFIFYGLMLVVLIYKITRKFVLINALSTHKNSARFLCNISKSGIVIQSILLSFALFFIFLTLLHPRWNNKEETIIQQSRDLFIALDISRSMLAQDLEPNRLTAAKNSIKELIHALDSDRIGLILFSGSSFIQCPLTRDRAAFKLFLDQVDTDTIASGTTALDKAIELALHAFKESGTQKNKLLLIYTDGEDFSHNLQNLKKEAHDQELTIFTIGLGSAQGAPIPLLDAHGAAIGHLKDRKGAIVISKLNETMLKVLADELGGVYVHATDSHAHLQNIIALIQKKEREKGEEIKHSHLQEQYPLFLLVALILLLIEWLL
jgi:Ca-activated chloride channel family protein